MFLYLEDLVPNALIEVIESNTVRALSYPTIMQYGYQVIKELEKRQIDATLVIYRDKTKQFETEYENIFDFYDHEDVSYVKLKSDKNSQYLRDYFRSYQTVDTVRAMTSDESRKVLGIKNK